MENKDIDVTKMRILANWVLVKVDDDHNTYHSVEKGTDTGISVAPFGVNQATHLALTGEVVRVPEKLTYNGYIIDALKKIKDRSESSQKYIAEMRKYSMAYDVPIEVEVGYKVFFEYTTRLNAIKEGRVIENENGKFILIPYDMLVMAFRPGTNFDDVQVNDVYPLNGFLLIKPLEYTREKTAHGVVGAKTEADLFLPIAEDAKYVHRDNIWYANVLAAGCGVRGYADFPGRGGEQWIKGEGLKVGYKIAYDGRQQKRLEQPHHRVIFKKYTLYRIQRKDILGWFPDGNIGGLPTPKDIPNARERK